MTTIDTIVTKSSHAGARTTPGLWARTVDAAARIARIVSEGLERRRSRLALLGLTDDQLKDIGLSRADAEREGLRKPWR